MLLGSVQHCTGRKSTQSCSIKSTLEDNNRTRGNTFYILGHYILFEEHNQSPWQAWIQQQPGLWRHFTMVDIHNQLDAAEQPQVTQVSTEVA